jgi:hypothetical protein
MRARELRRFDGHILGAAFTSGDRFVVGRWPVSPFGGVADVMWARTDGDRVLLAERSDVLQFVGRHYSFERTERTRVRVDLEGGRRIVIEAGRVRMALDLGPPGLPSGLLRLRPRRLRELPSWIAVEDALLRPLVAPWIGGIGVRTRGLTNAGVREWYAIHDLRPIVVAQAWVDGQDLGHPARARRAGFGFSEFPEHPVLVRVTALFETAPRESGGSLG